MNVSPPLAGWKCCLAAIYIAENVNGKRKTMNPELKCARVNRKNLFASANGINCNVMFDYICSNELPESKKASLGA